MLAATEERSGCERKVRAPGASHEDACAVHLAGNTGSFTRRNSAEVRQALHFGRRGISDGDMQRL